MNFFVRYPRIKNLNTKIYVLLERILRQGFIYKRNLCSILNPFDFCERMPKEKIAAAELRKQRLKEKKLPNVSPSEIYLCVLGNGARGSARCLYVFTDHKKYIFNCGEGTQRLAHEHKMKLSKLEHVFVTHKSWENLGGLLGLSLTIQDIGVPKLTLHGPPDIENLYRYTKSFIIARDLEIIKRNYDDSAFVDNCMEVQYIPICSSNNTKTDSVNMSSRTIDCDSDLIHREKKRKLTEEKSVDVTVSYLCKGHSKPGRLLLEKCVEMGVPPGPLLGNLKNGEDVVLPSGKKVFSKDVISPEQPCPVFLVVECPSEDFLDNFVAEKKFGSCQRTASNPMDIASLVVHFSPPEIVDTSKYQEWMKKFPDTTCHLILNSDSSTSNSIAIHRIQHMLHLFHPQVFSLLQEGKQMENENGDTNEGNIVQAETLYRYYLRPCTGLNRDYSLNIDPKEFIEEAKKIPEFESSLQDLHKAIENKVKEGIEDEQYPEVVFLGTGSSIPSKVRNVSCILVNVNENSSIMLDCGEGSYSQLFRLYGKKNMASVLTHISCIFISHLHADHHLGLFTVLQERKKAFDLQNQDYCPVTIIAPKVIMQWFFNYNENFDDISLLYRFIDTNSLKYNNESITQDAVGFFQDNYENVEVSTVAVNHCPNAYGLVLQSDSKWKLVYSGDTTPCQHLVAAGTDCTLLIHEATMEDDLEDEAALKMHSTTSQAIDIAKKMNAEYTILTHFSQRYAKVPLFNEQFHSHLGCAFDFMKIRRCDLPIISLFIPTLNVLFAEHVEELQLKGSKRKAKLSLINLSKDEDTETKQNVSVNM